jgi:hypothetical protein
MRLCLILFLVLVISCDDESSLVQRYDVSWENDFSAKYFQVGTAPSETAQFFSLVEVSDGFLFIVKPTPGSAETIISKINANGDFVKDISFLNEFFYPLVTDGKGGVYAISSSGGQSIFKVRNLNANLEEISRNAFDLNINTYSKFFPLNRGLYVVRSDNGSIERYNYKGDLQWSRDLAEFGFPDFINPVVMTEKNNNEVTISYLEDQNDRLVLTHINTDGDLLWTNAFSMSEDFGGSRLAYNYTWSKRGQFYFCNWLENNGVKKPALVIINSNGSLERFTEITAPTDQFFVGPVLTTNDKGSLVCLGSEAWSDAANFRLLKLDSNGNTGWLGTFHQIAFDVPSAMIEQASSDVVFITVYGYLVKLHPQYN